MAAINAPSPDDQGTLQDEAVARALRPSVGRLREGLAELDAERGLSRASAAIFASYQAAHRYAPDTGIGVFELLTDARGTVVSVRLVRTGAGRAAWLRVAEELSRLLESRRLNVPPGAKGLVTRLHIERGPQLLGQGGARSRRAALGQNPVDMREPREESTTAHLDGPTLSPTLGVSSAVSGHPTRVRVEVEAPL
jgi:hypothetical protein